ncbi:phosphoribosylanthranilate isomerase [Mucilaginibacter limnophilus]|uniref:N-(5'-phosphoribosyl)anthranilate isomerase n=1 Tax=Mucilaginibacter limnophilus TaxID=1932778 RepID=A0A437MZ85_9SPHI|nr:phosphoribosylanthranilate isomerase [Mucilaginibacter limnophilus]RVU02936.1 phosphoribosylanthranilate isomerase [Mucilaginibacter limnophilus]
MKIKVCGLREPDNIQAVVALQPDYIGLICYDKSPRFIDDLSAEAVSNLSQSIIKTGVFVNESAEEIERLIANYGLGAIQLHGSETPHFCVRFKGKVQVIKAFGVDGDFDFNQLDAYTDVVDLFLFDTKTAVHGGSGKTFDWDILKNYTGNVPFMLSGGIGPDNIAEATAVNHPQFYGVDLNSRFETEPGIKNIEALQKAFNTIRN